MIVKILSALTLAVLVVSYAALLPQMTDQVAWILLGVLILGTAAGRRLLFVALKIPFIILALLGWIMILDKRLLSKRH